MEEKLEKVCDVSPEMVEKGRTPLYGKPLFAFLEGMLQSIRGNCSEAQAAFLTVDYSPEDFPSLSEVFGIFSSREEVNAVLAAWLEGQMQCPPPKSIDHLFERHFLEVYLEDPESLTYQSILDAVGFKGHHAFLSDYSFRSTQKQLQRHKNTLKDLCLYDRHSLSKEQQMSYDILRWSLSHLIEGERFIKHAFQFDQMDGVQVSIAMTLLSMHPLSIEEEAGYFVDRLYAIEKAFIQCLENIEEASKEGIYPPQFLVELAIKTMGEFVALEVEENPFYLHFKERLGALEGLEESNRQALLDKAKKALLDSVYPAYKQVIAFMEKFLGILKGNHGSLQLPSGQEYYAWKLKEHTTTEMTPQEVFDLGKKEVEKIQKAMKEILEKEGYTGKPLGELVQDVAKEERFLFPNTKEGKQDLLQRYKQIISDLSPKLDEIFDLRPKKACDVQAVPENQEEGAPGAYYCEPAFDGSRPGVFFANLSNTANSPTFGMMTLTLHEAIPGHHFQLTLAQESQSLPMFRKFFSGFNAYVEGWALYAEKLGLEYGYYETPFDELGHYRDEILRAIRLVVDTGIHAMGWSRQEAIDYMESNSGLSHDDVVTEVQRYFVCPGQACSYKIGQLKILQLRQKMKEALGEQFSIKDFHRLMLEQAAVPIDTLESIVDDYVMKKRA